MTISRELSVRKLVALSQKV